MPSPRSTDIFRALREHVDVGDVPISIHSYRRFNTGLAHYVYEVMTGQGPYVVRMADPDYWNGIPGGVYWHPRLRGAGVPVPYLIGYNTSAPFPYMILERLPGKDLGQVYSLLTPAQKRTLAEQIASIQNRVGDLPHAQWYGYLDSYETPGEPRPSWLAKLEDGLSRAQMLIERADIFGSNVVDRVRRAAAPFEPYFASVPPAPFLDDTTTKNVIVHEGKLTGIVDTDNVCFGDRLDVLALTYMALLSDQADTEYVDYWAEAWQLTSEQLRIMHLYSAMHCVYFMGEMGQKFNKDASEPAGMERVEYLHQILDGLLLYLK